MVTSTFYDATIAISTIRLLRGTHNAMDLKILQRHTELLIDSPKMYAYLWKAHRNTKIS